MWGTVCEDASNPRRVAEEGLRACPVVPQATNLLASRDPCPLSTDLTFLQSTVSQLWAQNLVFMLVLLPPSCDLGPLKLRAPGLSLHTSTLQMVTALPLTPVCRVNSSLIWPPRVAWNPSARTTIWLGRVSLDPGATHCPQTLCATKRQSPACRGDTAAEPKTHSVL